MSKKYQQIVKELKDLGKTEKDFRDACKELKIVIKTVADTFNDEQCELINKHFNKNQAVQGSSQVEAKTTSTSEDAKISAASKTEPKKSVTPLAPTASTQKPTGTSSASATSTKTDAPKPRDVSAEVKVAKPKKSEDISEAKVIQPAQSLDHIAHSTLSPKGSAKATATMPTSTSQKEKIDVDSDKKKTTDTKSTEAKSTEAKVIEVKVTETAKSNDARSNDARSNDARSNASKKKAEPEAKIISKPDALVASPKVEPTPSVTPVAVEPAPIATPVVEEPKVFSIVVETHQPSAPKKSSSPTQTNAVVKGLIPLEQLSNKFRPKTTGSTSNTQHRSNSGGGYSQNQSNPRNQQPRSDQPRQYQGGGQRTYTPDPSRQQNHQPREYTPRNHSSDGQQYPQRPRPDYNRTIVPSTANNGTEKTERKEFPKGGSTQLNNSFRTERPAFSSNQGGQDRNPNDRPSYNQNGNFPRNNDQRRDNGAPKPSRSINLMQLAVPTPSTEPSRADRRKAKLAHQEDDLEKGKGQKKTMNDDSDILLRANRSKKKLKLRKGAKNILTTPAAHKRIVRIDNTITVGELGRVMGIKANEIIVKLMSLGVIATINHVLDFDTATLVANEFNYEAKNVSFDEKSLLATTAKAEDAQEDPDAVLRAPVVTIMGHVDHGKTTLLDRIRSANVAKGEAGGITQHIGAYKVETKNGSVVFLDTPGHAAFSAMRARGASVTDLIVLVVAADDGIMPQTIESIKHAQAAEVPIIVAVNKIDKPNIDPERIRQELTQYNIVPEEWGGEHMFINISGLTGKGVPELLDSLALQAEVLELKANPKKQAYGRVVEARIDKGRGTIATVLVQEGTLKVGDYMLVGQYHGKVKSLTDHLGKVIKSAGPSTPVEVSGLNGVPAAGEEFYLVKSEKDAKIVIANREQKAKELLTLKASTVSVGDPFKKEDKQVLNIMLKADVSGSLEAIKASLESINNDEVQIKIIASSVGQITESDIMLAMTANAKVIGFNVGPDSNAKKLAEQHHINCHKYSIIYELIDAVKDMLSGLLAPEIVEEILGKAQVRAIFNIQKIGSIAGCMVTEGKATRSCHARVFRDGKQVFEGKISTLKRFKDDVKEVTSGYECGICIDGYKEIMENDNLVFIDYKEIRRKID